MPPNHFESEVESFLEGSHGDRTHIKRADHHTVTPLCGTLLLMVGVSAKKFAQHTKNGPKLAFCGVLGELFRGNAAGGAVQGEFFRGLAAVGPRRASLLRRVPGSRTPLLAVLTLQCAAKPTWWPMGSTAHAPLGGLTCA